MNPAAYAIFSFLYTLLVIVMFRIVAKKETSETYDVNYYGDGYVDTSTYHVKVWNINSKFELLKYLGLSIFFPITLLVCLLHLIFVPIYKSIKTGIKKWNELPNF